MSNNPTMAIDRKELRSRFKSAQGKHGFEGIRDTLTQVQVSMLSCAQALKAIDLLDERLLAAGDRVRTQKANGNAVGNSAAGELKNLQEIERQVLLGIITNPDMHAEYERQLEIVRDAALDDLPQIWGRNVRRNIVNENMAKAFEKLLIDFPEFTKIRYVMQRAADALLEENGLHKLEGFWDERLKCALYPCPRPLEERIEIRTRHAPEPDDTTHAVHILKEDVKASLDRLPYFLHRFIEEFGYTLRIAERLAYIDKQYAVEAQKAAARSHDVSSKGVHIGTSRHIDIPLYNVSGNGEVSMASNGRDDMDMTLAHEGFHGIGEFMDDIEINGRELAQAYAADLEDLLHCDLSGFEYNDVRDYMPKSQGGTRDSIQAARIEAFAEIGGEVSLGYNDNYIGDCFPRTTAYMKRLKNTLDVVYDICPRGGSMPKPDTLERRYSAVPVSGTKAACFVMS